MKLKDSDKRSVENICAAHNLQTPKFEQDENGNTQVILEQTFMSTSTRISFETVLGKLFPDLDVRFRNGNDYGEKITPRVHPIPHESQLDL
jgi:hypothetical protein